MQQQNRIIEIICLSSNTRNGRHRVLKPGDFKDGAMWDFQVQTALKYPSRYEIHRQTIDSVEAQELDISKIELREMKGMSRERVSEIAEFYGIADMGQGRSALIDQIASERDQQTAVLEKHGKSPEPSAESLNAKVPVVLDSASDLGQSEDVQDLGKPAKTSAKGSSK
jgi:hypothetical protein